jgi:hypothetical protein
MTSPTSHQCLSSKSPSPSQLIKHRKVPRPSNPATYTSSSSSSISSPYLVSDSTSLQVLPLSFSIQLHLLTRIQKLSPGVGIWHCYRSCGASWMISGALLYVTSGQVKAAYLSPRKVTSLIRGFNGARWESGLLWNGSWMGWGIGMRWRNFG